MSTSTKRKKKGKDNDLLPKPKRPMSAYNFFFREQRNEILEAGGDAASIEKKSFEDIGRVIGQRWREILPDELAKYQELAKKDAERYRNEMKVFYEEELALMCSGHASVAASLDDDRKPSATDQKPTRDKQTMQNCQQQQRQQQQTIGRERFTAVSPSATLSAPVSVSSLATATQTNTNVIGAEQLLKLQTMLQHQENNAFSVREVNKESLINEINAQRLAIQRRLVTLLQESETLRAKDRLLEQLFANLSGTPGSSLNSTDARASVAAPAGAGFHPSISSDLQAAFPHSAQGAPAPRAGNFGVPGPASRMAPSLGQLFNQPQQALTTDNASLITQLMASQGQLHQQFTTSSGASAAAAAAAASSSNHSSTPSNDCTNQSLFANNITNSLQTGPMHDLQTLLARSVAGSTSQSQISRIFGLAGSFFNNTSQPPPEIVSLIAQIIASQRNEERSSSHAGESERN